MQLVAYSDTVIPNLPRGVSGIKFGSTAPPSAAGDKMVFAGFDNEESPTYGGIYLAPLVANPTLTTLVGIGDAVLGGSEEGDDGETPRWRNSAFVAVSAGPRDTFMVACNVSGVEALDVTVIGGEVNHNGLLVQDL